MPEIDYVVSGGCSFTRGRELLDLNNKFVQQIANKNDASLIDFSGDGFNNEAISCRLIDGLLKEIRTSKISPDKTLVIVNWTFITRLVFFNKSIKGWFSLYPERAVRETARKKFVVWGKNTNDFDEHSHVADVEFYYSNHTDPLYLLYYHVNILHKTKTFLEHHGFNNYVFGFMCGESKKMLQMAMDDYDNLIANSYSKDGFGNFKNIIDDIDQSKFFDISLLEFAKENKYEFGHTHPLDKAHIEYAKLYIDFIEKNILS